MSRTAQARPHRRVKSPKRNLGEIAFHLKNATFSLERLERQNVSHAQRLAVRGVAMSLRATLAVVTAAQDAFA